MSNHCALFIVTISVNQNQSAAGYRYYFAHAID
jgi:hypothetical protein